MANIVDPEVLPAEYENHLAEDLSSMTLGDDETTKVKEVFQKVESSATCALVDSKFDMEIQPLEGDAPPDLVNTFEELPITSELLEGLYSMGFNCPSKFQKIALPALLANPPQNMIAQFQCGMGKTTAFVLASLCRVDPEKFHPQVLVLSPTYDLAIQTGQIARQMTRYCPKIKIHVAIKGKELDPGLKLKGQVVIGTPGKVLDWATRYHFFDIKKIAVFVLDEADVMLDNTGHQDQSIRIHKSLSRDCQMMLFLPTYKKRVMDFAEQMIKNPVVICLRKEEYLDNIKQYYVPCKNDEDKFNAISNIYGVIAIRQALIFCHTRKTGLWLMEKMVRNGHSVGLLSGDLTVEQRLAVLNCFRRGKAEVMITTDVCARVIWKWYPYRGTDDDRLAVVVNFDLPMDLKRHINCEIYFHRIGRTGYFNKAGLVINMVEGKQCTELLKKIEEHFGREILRLDANNPDEIEQLVLE